MGLGPCQGKTLFLSFQSENWALSQITQWTPWPGAVWQLLCGPAGWAGHLDWQTPSQGAAASVETEGNLVSEDPDARRAEPVLRVVGQWPHLLRLSVSCLAFAVLITAVLKCNSHIMQLTHLQCTTQWFLNMLLDTLNILHMHSYIVIITTVNIRTYSSPHKVTCTLYHPQAPSQP